MADTTVEDKVVVEGEMVDSIEEKTVHILKNDRIYVSIGNANLDVRVPSPNMLAAIDTVIAHSIPQPTYSQS